MCALFVIIFFILPYFAYILIYYRVHNNLLDMIWRDIMIFILNRINVWIDILYNTFYKQNIIFEDSVNYDQMSQRDLTLHIINQIYIKTVYVTHTHTHARAHKQTIPMWYDKWSAVCVCVCVCVCACARAHSN